MEIYYRARVVPGFPENNIYYEEVVIRTRTKKGCYYISSYDYKQQKEVLKFICESRYKMQYNYNDGLGISNFAEVPTIKRYAWPTKKEALISLKFRNKAYIDILDQKLVSASHDKVIINKAIYDMENPKLIEDKRFEINDI